MKEPSGAVAQMAEHPAQSRKARFAIVTPQGRGRKGCNTAFASAASGSEDGGRTPTRTRRAFSEGKQRAKQ